MRGITSGSTLGLFPEMLRRPSHARNHTEGSCISHCSLIHRFHCTTLSPLLLNIFQYNNKIVSWFSFCPLSLFADRNTKKKPKTSAVLIFTACLITGSLLCLVALEWSLYGYLFMYNSFILFHLQLITVLFF